MSFPRKSYDVVIVGGGHNGLVAGAYLSRAGLSTLVLERRRVIGGASATEELWPGFRFNTAAHLMGLLQPKIILDLELQKFGYEVIELPPQVHPLADGSHFVLWSDRQRFAAELGRYSRKDAAAYPAFEATLDRIGRVFQKLLWEIPFDPRSLHPLDLIDRLRFLWRQRAIAPVFADLYELLTASAFDYLSRRFESEAALAVLGYYPAAAAGQTVSIHTPGTAYYLLRGAVRDSTTSAGSTGVVRGGMGSIPEAIAASGRRFGLEVRTDAEVASILASNGRASGVALASGEEIGARVVVANAAARSTFLDLVDPSLLPDGFLDEIRVFRDTASSFKIHWALDRLPAFDGFPADRAGFAYPVQFRVAPSVDYVEASYTAMKAGRIAERPYLTVLTQSVADPSLAPEGGHVVSLYGGHVPFKPQGGWDEAGRQAIRAAALGALEEHAPGFSSAILHEQILAPSDFEDIFGLPGGNPHHADVDLDRLFFRRPALGYADYRSPVPGLYLASASVHPGGGVTGVPGHNAARVILADLKRRRR
ncbi:phytoene desaturase family protein [Pleomorphomonas carboxyditropha]|uniref:Pyridine nucleotide-disulfide oxidoreductase domain-containing protein 2 n=1 Tax=Pleomorphomonas carboxyditropha TaxID=2023338 RepID=A0A2G9WZE1_9HYPH|nr:NAD(P)/FAD-dependent oxidoreductase [Pleomorphomonas carboxyditropha]PIP00040.1 oxidoreductase [Pleomorphomonas carboxyditropha]